MVSLAGASFFSNTTPVFITATRFLRISPDSAPASFLAPRSAQIPVLIPDTPLYDAQLQQMADMGFPNREANLAALALAGGNVDVAINRLLAGS